MISDERGWDSQIIVAASAHLEGLAEVQPEAPSSQEALWHL